MLHTVGWNLVKVSGAFVGRGRLARATRFLTNAVRLDAPNRIGGNGELMVIERVLQGDRGARPFVVIDCGANVGEYSLAVQKTADPLPSGALDLHSFEPSACTFGRLKANLESAAARHQAHLHQLALSDEQNDHASFHISTVGGGANSLVRPDVAAAADSEAVRVSTLDLFCAQQRIESVDLLKIDTEGNDYNVLLGGRQMFAAGRVRVVQFEYNYRWVYARRFLRDAFALLGEWSYEIGKVTPDGIEFYREWHPELEKFVEGNYVACRHETKAIFPHITWWGDLINIPPAKR